MKRTLFVATLCLTVSAAYSLDTTPEFVPLPSHGTSQPSAQWLAPDTYPCGSAGLSALGQSQARQRTSIMTGPRAPETTEIFRLYRYCTPSYYYLSSGAEGDTFAVYLKPLATCSLYWVQQQWNDAGTVEAYLWEANPEWLAAFPGGRADAATAARGTVHESPLGDVIAGPNEALPDSFGWDFLFDQPTTEALKIYRRYGEGFLAGFVKQASLPHPLSDDGSRGFCYTWFGGPWAKPYGDTTACWGMYSSSLPLDLILEAGIAYWIPPLPIIESLTNVCNTVNGHRATEITVHIVVGGSGWSANNHAWLVWQGFSGGTPLLPPDSVEIFDYDGDNTFTGTIPDLRLDVGNVVEYWVTALTDQDGYNTSIEDKRSFKIVPEASADAVVLWMDDGSFGSPQLWGSVYHALLNMGIWDHIDFYDVHANHGFDNYLIDQKDWDVILYTATGSADMPFTAGDDDPFSTYIANGGDFIYADPDYMWINGVDGDQPTLFASGDFAFDVFGLVGGYSDPVDADNNWVGDSSFVGVAGTVTDSFATYPFVTYPHHLTAITGKTANIWADPLYPSDPLNRIFYGSGNGLTYGVMNTTTGGGTAYYMAFDVALASDRLGADEQYTSPTDQLQSFINTLLSEFTSAPERGAVALPTAYELKPNYPNPFNPVTRIVFDVPRTGDVTLEVFNLLGQRVALLQEGVLKPGSYTRTFDASALASGTYLCRMEAGGFVQTRKLVLIK